MKSIELIEYIGNSDKNGKPIGHANKILKEYIRLLQNNFECQIATPFYTDDIIDKNKILKLKYCSLIYIKKSILNEVIDFVKKFSNIHKALNNRQIDIYWFCNVDFKWFMYMFLFKNYSKIACTLFQQYNFSNTFVGKIKQYIVNEVLSSVDLVIYSNPNLKFSCSKSLYMPDYYYDQSFYNKFKYEGKKNKVVCLGTMSKNKLLRETITRFNKMNINLEIVGKFYDDGWYEELKKECNSNVSIYNKYLTEEEYFYKLSEAKYCIIPYDVKVYKLRTSGVLLESIFLNTIPITFNSILLENNIKGIGIDTLNDLTIDLLNDFRTDEFYDWSMSKKEVEFNYDIIKNNLISEMEYM